jgi:predicted acyl esterase
MKGRKLLALVCRLVLVLVGLSFMTACEMLERQYPPAQLEWEDTQMFGHTLPYYFIRDADEPGYPLPKGIIVEKDVTVKMRDGCILRCDVFRPDKPGRFPVITTETLYGKETYGYGKGLGFSECCSFEAPDPAFWVPNGYVFVLFDQRGRGMSSGQAKRGWSGDDEYDEIEWCGTQPWSNGNVGMLGISALATCQWWAAAAQPPHLKCIIPWEGGPMGPEPTPKFGGIPETEFMMNVVKLIPPMVPAFGQFGAPPTPPPVLNLSKITVPVLACATFSDYCVHTFGTFWGFEHIASKDKWLFTHGRQKWVLLQSREGLAAQKQFFDYFLKGIDNGMMDVPKVRLEVKETIDKWSVRYENEWPIARTEYKKLYLDANTGTLKLDKVGTAGKISYDWFSGSAVFDIKFDQDTELTGYMNLKLWVSTDESDDMDIFVVARKFDARGKEVCFTNCHFITNEPAAMGWLRLSNRALNPKLSTPYQPIYKFGAPEKVKPGEIVPCEIAIYPSSTLFRKGETLRLEVAGKFQPWSPWVRFDLTVNKGKSTIYTGGEYHSYLQVPVIPATR